MEWLRLSLFLATVATTSAFYNPIVELGQDPSVKLYQGTYYLVQRGREFTGVGVQTAARLEDLGQSPLNAVWTAPGGSQYCCDVWAPELVFWDDENRWYIYFAADNGDNASHRTYVLQGQVGAAPDGPYTFLGKIATATDNWAIDSTVIAIDDQRYFVWSGWPGDVDGYQNLYIAQMSSPTTFSSDRQLLSSPTNDWETDANGQGVNEGPAPLSKDGRIYIAYSASGSWDDSYCLGLLTYLGGDPLGQASWQKSDGCVFQSNAGASVYGTGHNSFTESPDGTETWNVYHADEQSGGGWAGRSIRAQKLNWNDDGSPNFGQAVGYSDWVDPPSGE